MEEVVRLLQEWQSRPGQGSGPAVQHPVLHQVAQPRPQGPVQARSQQVAAAPGAVGKEQLSEGSAVWLTSRAKTRLRVLNISAGVPLILNCLYTIEEQATMSLTGGGNGKRKLDEDIVESIEGNLLSWCFFFF